MDRGVERIAQTGCARRQGCEHRLNVCWRVRDHLENLTCSRQIAIARFQLLEQPHILDSDDGLVGEGLEQLDLLIREWRRSFPRDGNQTKGPVSAYHRNHQPGLVPSES